MSSIGKIFIVLNLALAGAFFGWAVHAHNVNADWKGKYEKATQEADTFKKLAGEEKEKLAADKKAAEMSVARLTGERDKANDEKARLEADLADARQKGNTMQSSLTKISETLQGMEDGKAKLQADKDKAERAQRDAEEAKRVAEAARDEADKAAGQLRLDLDGANAKIADLEKDKTGLQKTRDSLETQLATLIANTGAKLSDFAPTPDIKAAVLDVSTSVEPGLIALNKGSKDGVVRGHTFQLYDGKTYKGEARVEFVHDNMCSAILTRKVDGQSIRQGDSAATRL